MMKVLIIEDEPRAANRLGKMLQKLMPECEILAKLESVRDAIKFLQKPGELNLILADIQLVDGLSFEIFKKVEISCPIIFTTAYDSYAIEAFNTNGIDYLLKPIEEQRLEKALQKLNKLSTSPDLTHIIKLLSGKSGNDKKYKSRFLVKVGENIKTVLSSDIKLFYSFDGASFILTVSNHNYIVDYTLDSLEEMIDPENFFRINRKYLVGINACNTIYAWSNSRLKLEIDGHNDEIVVARERVNNFKEWLDG